MATLSSILVQRGAASMRAVEDAIARQVLHGGDLPTNLLEQSSVSEPMLTLILAESVGLEPAPMGRLPAPSVSVLRLIPSDLAQRHNVFPLELRGRTLFLATSEPLSPAVEDDLGFALGVSIHQQIAPLVRIRQALADHYAVPLERRFLRLLAKLDKRAELSPSTAPPAVEAMPVMQPPRAVSILSPSFGTGVPASEPDPELSRQPQRHHESGAARGRLEDIPATKTPYVADSAPGAPLMPVIPPSPGVPRSLQDLADEGRRDETPSDAAPPTAQSPSIEGTPPGPPVVHRAPTAPPPSTTFARAPSAPPPPVEHTPAGPPVTLDPPLVAVDPPAPLEAAAPPVEAPAPPPIEEPAPPIEAPAPAPLEAPAPPVEAPAPPVEAPAPAPVEEPAPPVEAPAPAPVEEPAPPVEAPAPVEEPAPPVEEPALDPVSPIVDDVTHQDPPVAQAEPLAPPVPAAGAVLAPTEPAPAPRESAAVSPTAARGTRALAGWLRQEIQTEKASAPIDKTQAPELKGAWRPPRRKGPFTVAMAESELDAATSTDTVLDIFFAFANQFFEYAVLFVIHGDLAEGHDASGAGADRAKVKGIGVPLDLPSTLARARERRAPVIARLGTEGLDADLQRDLARGPRTPARTVALLPVVVRNRTVAILYGDDGETDVELTALGDVIALTSRVAAVLERIALRKKLGVRGGEVVIKIAPPAPVEAPVAPKPAAPRSTGAAALARALALPVRAPAPTSDDTDGARGTMLPAEQEATTSTTTTRDDRPSEPQAARIARLAESAPEDDDDHGLGGGRTTRRGLAMPPIDLAPPAVESDDEGEQPTPLIPLDGTAGRSRERPTLREVRRIIPESPLAPEAESPTRPIERPAARRGQAPVYLGRSKTPAVRSALEPLPTHPPPNARAWTTFPSPPPPAPPRGRSDRPIPREEEDSPFSPGVGVIASAAVEPGRPSPIPSVIIDLGAEYNVLLHRVIEGGPGSQDAFKELVQHGDHLLSPLMAKFPGPLRIDRHRIRGELPAASQCGAVLELIVAIRRPALPFVTVKLSSHDVDVRFWATHVLGELRYPEAANVLVPRLFDDDAAVRRVARRSAASLVAAGAAGAPLLQGLDNITRSPDQPVSQRLTAIEAMGEIRAAAMVPSLIAVLADPSTDVAEAARRSLLLVARQDFAHDARRFRDWWTRNGGRHRIEWLIDALMHEQPSIRRAAGDELKLLTKEYFGYYDDLPKRERERAQSLYRSWWEREGRDRFS